MQKKDKQPNFQRLFFEHFGRKPRKQRYELRFESSNIGHDVIFLSSLIHDARFKRQDMRTRGTGVYIDLERDAWELGIEPLNWCKSRLSIRGVVGTELREVDPLEEKHEEFYVQEIVLTHEWGQTGYDNKDYGYRLVMKCFGREYHMLLDEKVASVVLQDTTVPQFD